MVAFETVSYSHVCYGRIFSRFDTIHERDERQTDTARRHRPRLCIASRGKNSHSAVHAWRIWTILFRWKIKTLIVVIFYLQSVAGLKIQFRKFARNVKAINKLKCETLYAVVLYVELFNVGNAMKCYVLDVVNKLIWYYAAWTSMLQTINVRLYTEWPPKVSPYWIINKSY